MVLETLVNPLNKYLWVQLSL